MSPETPPLGVLRFQLFQRNPERGPWLPAPAPQAWHLQVVLAAKDPARRKTQLVQILQPPQKPPASLPRAERCPRSHRGCGWGGWGWIPAPLPPCSWVLREWVLQPGVGASPHERGRYSRGAPAALGVQAGPAGIQGESQELKQEGLALPNPAPLLCQLQKFIPPMDPASVPHRCQILHHPIPPSVHPLHGNGAGPSLASPRRLQEGKMGAWSICPGAAPHSL